MPYNDGCNSPKLYCHFLLFHSQTKGCEFLFPLPYPLPVHFALVPCKISANKCQRFHFALFRSCLEFCWPEDQLLTSYNCSIHCTPTFLPINTDTSWCHKLNTSTNLTRYYPVLLQYWQCCHNNTMHNFHTHTISTNIQLTSVVAN